MEHIFDEISLGRKVLDRAKGDEFFNRYAEDSHVSPCSPNSHGPTSHYRDTGVSPVVDMRETTMGRRPPSRSGWTYRKKS